MDLYNISLIIKVQSFRLQYTATRINRDILANNADETYVTCVRYYVITKNM